MTVKYDDIPHPVGSKEWREELQRRIEAGFQAKENLRQRAGQGTLREAAKRRYRGRELTVMSTSPDTLRQEPFGKVKVEPAGKPPKLRWKPGQFVNLEGQIYEIMYCYRLYTTPSEWVFMLEERRSVVRERDVLGAALDALGCGSQTPRVVYDVFRDYHDAWSFFADIPRNGNSRAVTNKTMMAKAKLVSSGAVHGP